MELQTYSNILKNNNKNKNNNYKCNICNKCKQTKVWLEYIILENKNIKICSYLCSKKYFEDKIFKLDNTVNKKDFDLVRPIIKKNIKPFQILSREEINNLDDNNYLNYCKNLDNYILFNPERAKLQLNIQKTNDNIDYLLNQV
tara:strand:+ start:109 stop:537 length:429 start_codon:yes stop_codon:yes gene_type:complete